MCDANRESQVKKCGSPCHHEVLYFKHKQGLIPQLPYDFFSFEKETQYFVSSWHLLHMLRNSNCFPFLHQYLCTSRRAE